MQSVKRIPSESHRLTYYHYTRDSFRSVNSPLTVIERIKDAEDQLERMDYYHSIREQKKNLTDTTKNKDSNTSPAGSTKTSIGRAFSNKDRVVNEWIQKAVPILNIKDAQLYADYLVKDGFDSVEIIEQELTPDDLDFMKKAHKRALVRYLNSREDETEC